MEVIPLSPACFGSENISTWHLSHLTTKITTERENEEGVVFSETRANPFFICRCFPILSYMEGGGRGRLDINEREREQCRSTEKRSAEPFPAACNGISLHLCNREAKSRDLFQVYSS